MDLLHGTSSSRVKAIQEEGLDGDCYLTNQRALALFFALHRAEECRDQQAVLLQVTVPEGLLEKDKHAWNCPISLSVHDKLGEVDYNDWQQARDDGRLDEAHPLDGATSLQETGCARYPNSIPATDLRVQERFRAVPPVKFIRELVNQANDRGVGAFDLAVDDVHADFIRGNKRVGQAQAH